jgi:mercuric ion transport protein
MRSALNVKTALFGGIVAGIGASACCVGPLLLLSLGVGGAWIAHLTALESYRPIFIVLAVVLFGWAFRKLYLLPHSCKASNECVADRTRGLQRVLFWVFLPITLGLIGSPWIVPIFHR